MTLRLALKIDGDSTGARRAAEDTVRAVRDLNAETERTGKGIKQSAESSSQSLRGMAGDFLAVGREAAGADSKIVKVADSAMSVWQKIAQAGDAAARSQQQANEKTVSGMGAVLAWGSRVLGWIGIAVAAWELLKLAQSSFGDSAADKQKKVDEALERQATLIEAVRARYGEAGDAALRFAGQSRETMKLSISSNLADIEKEFRRVAGGVIFRDILEKSPRELRPFTKEIQQLMGAFERGDEQAVRGFVSEIARLGNETPALADGARKLKEMFDRSSELEGKVQELRTAFRLLAQDATMDPGKVFGETLRRLQDMSPQRNRGDIAARDRRQVEIDANIARRAITESELNPSQEAAQLAAVERARRNAIAAIDNQTDAYQQLSQRVRDQIDEQRLEISLGDKGAEAVNRLRIMRELERTAKRAGVAVDKEKLAALADEAVATERLLNITRLRNDVTFERDQLGRSDIDQQIATRLRAVYGGNYQREMDGAIAAQMRWNDQARISGELIDDALVGGMRDLRNELRQNGLSWEALGKAGLNSLTRISDKLMDMAAQQLVKNAFGGINLFSWFGGGGGTPAAAPMDITGGFHPGLYHRGGIAGVDPPSGYRYVHPAYFENAPRFHGGKPPWGPDELGAIIKRNEEVLTEDDPRHRWNLAAASAQRGPSMQPLVQVFPAAPGETFDARIGSDGQLQLIGRMIDDKIGDYDTHRFPARFHEVASDPRARG